MRARDTTIEELTAFKQRALSQLAAQHDESTRLRRHTQQPGAAVSLDQARAARTTVIGPC
ncbi:hypothetical protein [Streptomyces chartreusis]|uniref:hypothetical protein n=1 Tax=Streptomyces chartreusis TaxID=1969 RepID=UPI00363FE3AD